MMSEDDNNNGKNYFYQRLSLRKLIFYAASLSLIILIYIKFGELQDLREVFRKSNLSWLIMAVFFQILNYYFLALSYHFIFKLKGHYVSVWQLYPFSLITQFFNQAFPSAGISGQIFLIDYLRARGASVEEGIGRAILEIASLFCGFGIMFVVASVLFFVSPAFAIQPQLIYLIYVFWVMAVLCLAIFFIIQRLGRESRFIKLLILIKSIMAEQSPKPKTKKGFIRKYWSIIVEQLVHHMSLKWLDMEGRGNLFIYAVFCQCAEYFLDILTLYALAFALDIHIGFLLVFVIFTFVQFVSMISFVPGSLIVYEGGMVLMLIAFGVERGAALTLALLFRALTFWLPMPIGWLLYRQHEKDRKKQEKIA